MGTVSTADQPSFPLPPGTAVGHYEVLDELGRGGMGIVYRARDLNLRRDVALKCPWPHLASDPGKRRRFMREARAASQLSHPNIVPVFEAFEDLGLPWLSMAVVEGESLAELLKRDGARPVNEALRLAADLAGALHAAHEAGVLHRDLSTRNVMITHDGRALVTDFGLARFLVPPDSERVSEVSTLTQEGHVVGTPPYMSPEQALGKALDRRSDIFSLGAILYEMCSGKPAFGRGSREEILDAVVHRDPPPLSRSDGPVPEELEQIIRVALAKDPHARYQTAADMLSDLRAERRQLDYEDFVEQHPTSSVSMIFRRRRRRQRLLAGAAVVFAVVGIALIARSLIQTSGPRGSFAMRAIVTRPGLEYDGRFTPDGQSLSFISDAQGTVNLWKKNLSGGDPQIIANSPKDLVGHLWSPDGREMACLLFAVDAVLLQIIPAAGGPPVDSVRLDELDYDARLVRWIRSNIYLQSREALFRFNRESRQLEQLIPADGTVGIRSGFDVRTDEARVAFSVAHADQATLWVADLDGRRAKRLTSENYAASEPRWWGPDERYLVYASNRSGQRDLWNLSVADGSSRQVTFSSTGETPEDVSADGSALSFRETWETSNLWVLDPTTEKTWQLTADSLQDFWPIVSAGGTLVYHRRKPSVEQLVGVLDTEILVGDLDAVELGHPRQAARVGAAMGMSPDGALLAFVRPAEKGYQLWTTDLESGHTVLASDRFRLPAAYAFPLDFEGRNVSWSANPARLYFVAVADDGSHEIRRIQPRDPKPQSELVVAAAGTYQIGDPHLSPDGRQLTYVRSSFVDSPRSEIRCRDLETAEDRLLHEWNRPAFSRGWLTSANETVAILASYNDDRTEQLEVVLLTAEGKTRSVGEIASAFGGTARLDPVRETLYLTKVDDDGVSHNLYEFALADGRLRRITDNKIRGITFSGLDVVPGGPLVYARHENNVNLWMVQFNR